MNRNLKPRFFDLIKIFANILRMGTVESTESKTERVIAKESDERTLSEIHKDIDFSNQYRIEYIKHLITIAAAIFAFTLTFLKDVLGKPLNAVGYKPILILGWLSLIVSLMGGIAQMRFWAMYFVSWGISFNDEQEIKWRDTVNKRRLKSEFLQIVSFFIGLFLLLVFSSLNLYY